MLSWRGAIAFNACILTLCLTAAVHGGKTELVVTLPNEMNARAATATARDIKLDSSGRLQGQSIIFSNLLPETPYDVVVTLTDGTVVQGIDLGWYSIEPPRQGAKPMSKDAREQVRAIIQDIPSFYNKSEILRLRGDNDRAVALVQLVRDTDFYHGAGEVVWRIELWYFKNQYGGWEKVQQQNKVLRRERFKTHDEFEDATRKLRWAPDLGGVTLGKDERQRTITLTPSAMESDKVTPSLADSEEDQDEDNPE